LYTSYLESISAADIVIEDGSGVEEGLNEGVGDTDEYGQ
jgi:hypothetical protein